jgi:nitrogen fixation/metabolism regulation signal transduction histidine kinase
MRIRSLLVAISILVVALALAAPAMAGDNGEGLVGETNDKIITFFSLGVVVFFTLATIVGSTIQARLEKRKEEKKAAELRQRIGW